MKTYLLSLVLLAAGAIFAADFDNPTISINRKNEDLIITSTGKGKAPDLSQAVDNVLKSKIGTHMYRNDVFAPKHNFGPTATRVAIIDGQYQLVGGDGFNNSSVYPNFFNAPLIKNTDWTSDEWISEIKKECLKISTQK